MLRVRDIVKLKDEVFRAKGIHQTLHIFDENLFTIKNLGEDLVQLEQIDSVSYNYDEIEAVLIDSQEDAEIYYNPIIAAAIIKDGDSLPEFKIDYRNYLLQFEEVLNSNGESYYDLIRSKGFRFVHEVQHWLQDEDNYSSLRINYTLRADLQQVLERGK